MRKPNSTQLSRMKVAAEAICGALYETGWEFLGETDDKAETYFTRGSDREHRVRVSVIRSKLAPYVLVKSEWPNLSVPGRVIRGQIVDQVDCSAYASDEAVREATGLAVVHCLEILRDVIAGSGVAGGEALSGLDFG